MCSVKVLLSSIILSNLLTLVLLERYLYKIGRISYKDRQSHQRLTLETRNVKYIDQHLIKDVVAFKVESIIPHLYEGAIRNMPRLKNMSLPNCALREISPGAFQNLPRLKNLHLQDNELEVIDEGVFNYLNVENLYLQRNGIHTIRSGAFDNMPLLRRIHLNNNSLSRWDSQWFKNTPSLMFLHFRRNQILELPESAFSNLRLSHKREGLKNVVIYLSKNKISVLHPRAFENVHNLRELWLDRNQIEKIDNKIFAHFTEIKRLFLHKNKISEVDKYAFRELNDMMELNLSFNKNLNCLDYEVVAHIKKVNVRFGGIYCSCYNNLKEKLQENDLGGKVSIISGTCLDDINEDVEGIKNEDSEESD